MTHIWPILKKEYQLGSYHWKLLITFSELNIRISFFLQYDAFRVRDYIYAKRNRRPVFFWIHVFWQKNAIFSKKKRLILERGVFWQLPFQLLVYFLRYLRLIPLHKGWGTIFGMDPWVPTENPWNMASPKNLSLITYFRQFLSSTLKVISQWQWLILKHGNSVYHKFKTILKSERPQILVKCLWRYNITRWTWRVTIPSM